MLQFPSSVRASIDFYSSQKLVFSEIPAIFSCFSASRSTLFKLHNKYTSTILPSFELITQGCAVKEQEDSSPVC
jgi:hypothetical protein